MVFVAPSLLAADFANLEKEIRGVSSAGADWLHYDVMDGHFVPNISMGIPVLESIRKVTGIFMDVHLMITEPVRYVHDFCRAGADLVTVHAEADTPDRIRAALTAAKTDGKQCGVALKPKTPAKAAESFLDLVDLILVMTVEPGFGGQHFMADQLEKIRDVRRMIEDTGRTIRLEVDGGIDRNSAPLCVEAGADTLVAGSAVFHQTDLLTAIREIRGTPVGRK